MLYNSLVKILHTFIGKFVIWWFITLYTLKCSMFIENIVFTVSIIFSKWGKKNGFKGYKG